MCGWVHREWDILHRQVNLISSLLRRVPEVLCGHSGTAEWGALPYAPLKNRNCCQFAGNKWKCSRCRFIANKGLRACKLWDVLRETRGEGTSCAQPRPHCLQGNETWIMTFTPFSNKAQQTEIISGHNSTSSCWELYSHVISSAFWTRTDFWGGKIQLI